MEATYRDALAGPGHALNADLPALSVTPRGAVAALEACRAAREAFLLHEKGVVRLQYLLMSLPAARATS